MQWDITQLLEKERNMLSELSQTEKDKYGMVSLICGVLKKKIILSETVSRMMVARGSGVWQKGRG